MSVLVGRVGLVIKGAWDSSVAYASMDVVTYNNSTYIAKQAVPAGTLPTNTTYWELSLDASLLANKVLGATPGNFAGLDANGDLTDSGVAATAVAGKADKVVSAVNDHYAALDENGNLLDSGIPKPREAYTYTFDGDTTWKTALYAIAQEIKDLSNYEKQHMRLVYDTDNRIFSVVKYQSGNWQFSGTCLDGTSYIDTYLYKIDASTLNSNAFYMVRVLSDSTVTFIDHTTSKPSNNTVIKVVIA